MAVINNLKALAVSFKVNDSSSRFLNVSGTYNTADILNGGELLDNTLEYQFKITGLQGHTIKSIVIKFLLLTSEGELCTSRNLTMGIDSYGNTFRGNFEISDSSKTIISTEFSQIEELEENEKVIDLVIAMNSVESCYYGLQSIVINLLDIDYAINISFSGSKENRTTSSITVATLLISQSAESVTFSKDPTTNYNSDTDAVEGRAYFRKDGIWVDGYLYGTVAGATGVKAGIVKIKDSFETFTETDPETGEVTATGIVAPTDSGVAASTIMLYNAINTLKTYTDELIDGIPAPSIELDDGTIEEIKEDYIFSNDFELTDKKLYIKWIEITSDGKIN